MWVVRVVSVRGGHGLHARPAAAFARTAKKFRCRVTVFSDRGSADGKSILELMTLGIAGKSTVTIAADGDDAEQAVAALAMVVEG
ncbi:MAG: HPr family phosphocarrier protein [Thermoanaerobaculaceae bacterium]|jgi:phosphocarrier protein FPr/phosphocarrier protein